MPKQIPLQLEFRADQHFDHYHPGANSETVWLLADAAAGNGEHLIYLWGDAGLGKTHLLQAICQRAHQGQRSAFYLPLKSIGHHGPEFLDGLESFGLVCVDDVEAIAGDEEWELTFFNFFNRSRDLGHHLIVAARYPPRELGILLPDLKTRLAWGLTLRLQSPDDEDKLAALTLRAKTLGFELTPQVGRFLIARYPRDLPSLWSLLARLDRATLAAKRKLTIPFLKSFLKAGHER